MNKITAAYLFSLVFSALIFFLESIPFLQNTVILTITYLISTTVLFTLLRSDAIERNKSQFHGLWGLFGIYGVILYHVVFVREKQYKKKLEIGTLFIFLGFSFMTLIPLLLGAISGLPTDTGYFLLFWLLNFIIGVFFFKKGTRVYKVTQREVYKKEASEESKSNQLEDDDIARKTNTFLYKSLENPLVLGVVLALASTIITYNQQIEDGMSVRGAESSAAVTFIAIFLVTYFLYKKFLKNRKKKIESLSG